MVKHKALGCIHNPRGLACMGATVAWNQPELGLTIRLRLQTLGRTFLAEHKRQRVEVDRVLKKHRPVGCDGEIVQESEAVEAVATVVEKVSCLDPGGGIIFGGEFHQADGAARAGIDPEGDHARPIVMTGIEARMGTEGLAFLQNTTQEADAVGLEGLGVERMGFSSFPEREQLVAKLHNAGIGDVFQPQIKGIGQRTSGFLASEHASIQHLAGRFLGLPTSGTHKPIGQRNPLSIELNRGDHAVTIKGMVHALTVTLQQPRAIAVEGSQ